MVRVSSTTRQAKGECVVARAAASRLERSCEAKLALGDLSFLNTGPRDVCREHATGWERRLRRASLSTSLGASGLLSCILPILRLEADQMSVAPGRRERSFLSWRTGTAQEQEAERLTPSARHSQPSCCRCTHCLRVIFRELQ